VAEQQLVVLDVGLTRPEQHALAGKEQAELKRSADIANLAPLRRGTFFAGDDFSVTSDRTHP
jgi:hypothetical protein